MTSLPLEVYQQQICPRIDLRSLLRLATVSRAVHQRTAQVVVEAVLALGRQAPRPLPHFDQHSRQLAALSGESRQLVETLLRKLTPTEMCRFLEQIHYRIEDRTSFPIRHRLLDAYPVLRRHYDALFGCIDPHHQYPNDSNLPFAQYKPFFDRLCALGVLAVDDWSMLHRFKEDVMIDAFRAAGQLHLLTDRDFLWDLILLYGTRLRLVTILYYVPIPDSIDELLPLYRGFWPDNDYALANWDFVRDLSRLKRPESRTPLEAFWTIASVRRFYERFADDVLDHYHGQFCADHFHLLRRLPFPYLADFHSARGVRRIYELGVSTLQLHLLQFVLVSDDTSIHDHLSEELPPIDVNDRIANGLSAVDCVLWSAIAESSEAFGPLFDRILADAPPSLWRQIALELRTGTVGIDEIFTIDSLQLPDLIPDLNRVVVRGGRSPPVRS